MDNNSITSNSIDATAGSVNYTVTSNLFSSNLEAATPAPVKGSLPPKIPKKSRNTQIENARQKLHEQQKYEKKSGKDKFNEFVELKEKEKVLNEQKSDAEALLKKYRTDLDSVTKNFKNELAVLKKEKSDMEKKCSELNNRLENLKKKSSKSKKKAKEIIDGGWIGDEWNEYFGSDNPILRLQSSIKGASKALVRERVEMCMVEMAWLAAPYHNVNSNEAQASLRVLLDKVVKKFDLTLYPVQRLDELETATVFNSCGMTISMSKRLRSLLGDNNIFASANKVNELLKTFDAQCEIKVENIEVEDTEIEVSTVENLFTAITNRYQKIADRKKFKLNPSSFENEIWISILGDKGGKSMKLALALGNQDSPNAPDKLLLCGMYDGPSTAKLIYAAFQKLASKIEDIDNIELKIDGVIKKFKVRWFLAGDYEFILQVTGRKSASATCYCYRCTFAKVNPNTFETAGACDKGTLRQKFEIGTDSGQEHEPLFLNIPPNQVILPCLHIFMGIVTMLLEKLEIYLKQEDFKKLTPEQREEVQIELESSNEDLRKKKEKLEENQLLISEKQKNLEILQDIETEFKEASALPANKNQRNRCNMDYCAKRGGYSVEDEFRACSCCSRPKKYHIFCIGSNDKSKTIKCSTLQKYQSKGGMLSEVSVLTESLKNDIDKRDFAVENLKNKIDGLILKKYNGCGENMKTYGEILNSMMVSKQAWFQTLCGNHVHKLLLNAERFEALPCLKESTAVQNIIEAFKLLKEIQSFTDAKFLNNQQKDELTNSVKALKLHMQKNLGEVHVIPKFHLLLHHFEDFVAEFQMLGYFTEQGIESLHAEINKVFGRAGFAKNKNQWLLKHQWRRNLLRDISNFEKNKED